MPDEKAVEQWSEEFISKLSRVTMKNRVVQFHDRLDPQEELKEDVSPLKALQNSVLQFGEVLTAIQQQLKSQYSEMNRKKLKKEGKLVQGNANLVQHQNKYQQQLHFDDPNDEITRQTIEMLNKKMQGEQRKIEELQQVAKDVLAQVDQVFQQAIDKLTNKKDQVPNQPQA